MARIRNPGAFSPTYGMDGVVVEPGRVGGDDNVVGLLRQIVLRLLNLLLLLVTTFLLKDPHTSDKDPDPLKTSYRVPSVRHNFKIFGCFFKSFKSPKKYFFQLKWVHLFYL